MHIRPANENDLRGSRPSISRGCLDQRPAQTDYVYILEHDGAYLGIGGLQLMNPTCGWVWLDLAPDALKHTKTLYATVRAFLDALMEEAGLTRLMAAVETDFPAAVRFAEHLGFVLETRMECWIENRPAFLYARMGG